jgi:hypothetical protein
MVAEGGDCEMSSYDEALRDFYRVEVGGEAIYSLLLGTAQTDEERLKWSTLLQLETETKAWLRAPMFARGLSVEEHDADRKENAALVEPLKTLPWRDKMQAIEGALSGLFIPRYQGYLDAAKQRGKADEIAVCLHMVEHEQAQLEFAQRELKGAGLTESLEPVVRHLKYPIAPKK